MTDSGSERSGGALTQIEASDATCPGLCRPPGKRFEPPMVAKVFLGLALLEMVLAVSFSAYTIIHVNNLSLREYSTLAIFSMLAFTYFACNAIFAENVFQLLAAVFVSILYTVFVVFKFVHRSSWGSYWDDWASTVLAVKIAFEAAYLGLCIPVVRQFGYRIYKIVGADEHLQAMYRTYLTFLSLVKADFVLGILLVTMSWFFFEMSSAELTLEVLALAITFLWAAGTWAMVVLENAGALRFSIVFALAEPAFIVYKLLQLFFINGVRLRAGATPAQFAIVGGVALLLRGLLIEYLVTASRNFGRGLRRKVFSHRRAKAMAEYGDRSGHPGYRSTASSA